MKHIKRYNESKVDILEELIDYAMNCFSEFSDDDTFETEFDLDFLSSFIIMINIPTLSEPYKEKYIDEFVKWSSGLNSVFLDVEVAINRVKDKYKDIEVLVEQDTGISNISNRDITYIRIYFKII